MAEGAARGTGLGNVAEKGADFSRAARSTYRAAEVGLAGGRLRPNFRKGRLRAVVIVVGGSGCSGAMVA